MTKLNMPNSGGDAEEEAGGGDEPHRGVWRGRGTLGRPDRWGPDVDPRARHQPSCLRQRVLQTPCSSHHRYQADVPAEVQHFLKVFEQSQHGPVLFGAKNKKVAPAP